MKIFQVTAQRWECGWELHIERVGVTQSRTVKDAEMMVRDYLRLEGVAEPYDVKIGFRAEDDIKPHQVERKLVGDLQPVSSQRPGVSLCVMETVEPPPR